MRSLLVLILVVAVLGGLGYLLFMDDTSDVSEPIATADAVDEPVKDSGVKASLDAPDRRTGIATPSGRQVIGTPEIIGAEEHDSGVSGRVVDEKGQPVEEVEMTLAFINEMFEDMTGPSGRRQADRKTKTDADGQYLFGNLEPANTYTVLATHAEFGSGSLKGVRVTYRKFDEQPDIQLSIGSALTGNITDPAGNPIVGATITLGPELDNQRASKRKRKIGQTNDMGHYVLPDISGGTFMFRVQAEGFATHTLMSLPFDGVKSRSRDVQLSFAEGIAGAILDQQGTPIKGAFVQAKRYKNSKIVFGGDDTTGADGEFELGDLEPGEFTVLVTARGYQSGRKNLVQTGTNSLNIELIKLASVSGQVMSAETGSPLTSGKVILREVINGTEVTNPTNIRGVVRAGRFSLEGVAEGEYLVEASDITKGFAPTFSEPFNVVTGEDFTTVVVNVTRGAELVGKIVDSEGHPVANAQVSTEDRAGYLPGWPTNIIPQKVRTDSAGHFKLLALKPETYRINVEASGYVKWAKQDVVISAGGDEDLGLITLSKGGTVTGTLIDNYGAPVVGCQVFMRLTDVGAVPHRHNARSKNDGRYTIENVHPGNYDVWSAPMGVDGPAPGGKRVTKAVFVRDNDVTTANLTLDYSTVRTRDGFDPRRPGGGNPKDSIRGGLKQRAAAGRGGGGRTKPGRAGKADKDAAGKAGATGKGAKGTKGTKGAEKKPR